MPEKLKILTLKWDVDEYYRFAVKEQTRSTYNEGRRDRRKNVYRGYFIDESPEGVEPYVICWLKHIQVDEHIEYPQLREQYDMADFPEDKAPHLRRLLARNPEAERIVRLVQDGHSPKAKADCYTVERSYSELTSDQIQYLTAWERLEYLDQYCTALTELYQTSSSVYGWPVAAHRDVKIDNGLILREKDRFRVVLLDFSSVRFEKDPMRAPIPDTYRPEFISFEGSQGTNPYMMSHENTCLEIVCSDYPTTQAADVYAMGTMLASLFGYMTPSIRNPNVYCCTKPSSQDRNKLALVDALELKARLLGELHYDQKLGRTYRGDTWLEHMLLQARTPFTWGDPSGAPYQLDKKLLDQVKELFFLATRIDPADRITMVEFHKRIHELKNSTPKQRSGSPKLYSKPECVYMIHQHGLQEHKALLHQAVADSLNRPDSTFPVRLYWYQNAQDGLYSSDATSSSKSEPFTSSQKLLTQIHAQTPSTPVPNRSLVDTIYNLWSFYDSHRYEYSFSGTIHIFSLEPFSRDVFKPIRIDGKRRTFNDFLEYLSELSGGELKVRFHSPYKLVPLQHHPSFRRVAITGLEERTTMPEAEPVMETMDPPVTPIPETWSEPPKQEAAAEPEVAVEKYYLLGSEGLFFLDEDGRKIYVTRKKIRR